MIGAAPRLGTVTIGQSPRDDIVPTLEAHVPRSVTMRHVGVLDGLSADEIAARYRPRDGGEVYVSRLRDGTAVQLDAARIRLAVQECVDALELAGCDAILILCTGTFPDLSTRAALLIEPERLLIPTVSALARHHRVGVIAPLASQHMLETVKWRPMAQAPLIGAASPYSMGEHDVHCEAVRLRDAGAELLVLDCIGFVERHRAAAQRGSGLPVILTNALVARIVGELLAGGGAPHPR